MESAKDTIKEAVQAVKYCNPVQFRTWNLYLIQTSSKLCAN